MSQTVAPTSDRPAEPKASKTGRWIVVAVLIAAAGATMPATIYGMATGDYLPLKSIADASRDLLQAGVKLMK